MRISTERYEQIARVGVRWGVEQAVRMKKEGLNPAPVSEMDLLGFAITDKEAEGFTIHNERKAKKFIDIELRMWKAGWRSL